MTTYPIYFSYGDNEVEEHIRRNHCCWLPITLLDKLDHQLRTEAAANFNPTSTGRRLTSRLPSDVALWLAELRYSSDSDEFISGLKLNVECENIASEVWLFDEDCPNQKEEAADNSSADIVLKNTSQLSLPICRVQKANAKTEKGITSQISFRTIHNETDIRTNSANSIPDTITPNLLSSVFSGNEQVEKHAGCLYAGNLVPGNIVECLVTTQQNHILQDNLREVKDCCESTEKSCKEDVHFSWNVNRIHSGSVINIIDEGRKCPCGGDCISGRGTIVRKLCHSALEQCIPSSVNRDTTSGLCTFNNLQDNNTCVNSVGNCKNDSIENESLGLCWGNSNTQQCLSSVCDYDKIEKNETNAKIIVQSSNLLNISTDLETNVSNSYTHDNNIVCNNSSDSEENTYLTEQKRLSMQVSNSSIKFKIPCIEPCSISNSESTERKLSLSHESDDELVSNFVSKSNLLVNINNNVAITVPRKQSHENDTMDLMSDKTLSIVDNKYTCMLNDLECILHNLQGMEDNSSNLRNELPDVQDPEILLLCQNANDLIEETLLKCSAIPQQYQYPKCQSVASSSLSDDVFLTSPNSLPEDANVFVTDTLIFKHNSVNVNNIFDNGTGPPVPPVRRKKIINGCLSKFAKDLPLTMSDSNLETEDKYKIQNHNKPCVTVLSISEVPKDREVAMGDGHCEEGMINIDECVGEERKIGSISYCEETNTLCQKELENTSVDNPEMSVECDVASQSNESRELLKTNIPLLENSSSECNSLANLQENSNSLSVSISQTKPISSFEFPPDDSQSQNIHKPIHYFGNLIKQPIRPVSSLEDCTVKIYDEELYGSLGRGRKGSGASDITAWKKDLQRAGLFSLDDDEWFSSNDSEERGYFFEEHISDSSWTLPRINIAEYEGPTNNTLNASVIRNQDDKRSGNRILKARSMVLGSPRWKDNSKTPSSVHGNWPHLLEGNMLILKEGVLNRTKITENGKKVRKNWAPAHVVLTELFLLFFKDSKSFSTVTAGRPELCVDLNGTLLDPGNKMSSRKNVSMVSTVLGLQVLFQCDDTQLAREWHLAISNAIKNLPSTYDRCPRSLTSTDQVKPLIQESLDTKSNEEQKRSSYILRSRSVKIKNRNGSEEDLLSSQEEQQTRIRDRLKKFFHRRPTRETLVRKGIYKDEPVFGCHLADVCPDQPPYVPHFVKMCIEAIEGNEENMNSDGLYRASGNLSQVQKIRLQVDQNKLTVLDEEEDIHVLTGTLKLFFRELKMPLIPYDLFNKALKAVGMNRDKKEKIQQFQEIVRELPRENHDTLKFLLEHLFRVTLHKESNRMHIPNVAIVFGPTLMWPEEESQNMALDLMQQNLVIEFLLLELDEIFR